MTPLGTGVENKLGSPDGGRSGIGLIQNFDVIRLSGPYRWRMRDFNPEDWIEKKEIKKMDPFIQYAMATAEQAMANRDWSSMKTKPR